MPGRLILALSVRSCMMTSFHRLHLLSGGQTLSMGPRLEICLPLLPHLDSLIPSMIAEEECLIEIRVRHLLSGETCPRRMAEGEMQATSAVVIHHTEAYHHQVSPLKSGQHLGHLRMPEIVIEIAVQAYLLVRVESSRVAMMLVEEEWEETCLALQSTTLSLHHRN